MTPSETIAQARQILEEVAAGQGDPTELLVMAGELKHSSPEAAEILQTAFQALKRQADL
jgi:uncharacterized protein YciU (UPF0263 family)